MPSFGNNKERENVARALMSAALPLAKYNPSEWKSLADSFCHFSLDPEFSDFICRGNIKTTETLLERLIKRQKSQKTHDAIARFMSYPHLFNRLSRAENEEKAFPLIQNLSTSRQRGDVIASHAWARNVLRRRNGSSFTDSIISLLDTLEPTDLTRAITSTQAHLAWTMKTYLPTEDAARLFKHANLEMK